MLYVYMYVCALLVDSPSMLRVNYIGEIILISVS